MTTRKQFDSEKTLNASGILVILIVGSLSVYTESDSAQWLWVAFLAVAILASFIACLLVQSDSQRTPIFWVMALLITSIFFAVEIDLVAILTIVWIVVAAELYGPRRAAMLAFASIIVFLLSQIYHSGIENLLNSLVSAVIYSLLQMFALSMVLRATRERKLHEETAMLNRELLATRELLSQSTAQAERVRIARDLHDILGHHMTALILNLEVAKHSVQQSKQTKITQDSETDIESEQDKARDKAQEKVEQALALAKLLLGDIRTAVSELREDDNIELLLSIEKLVSGIPGIRFDTNFTAAPKIRSVQLAETILRCVQESLTNIIRHSGASRCQIDMTESDGMCLLVVRDNGASNEQVVSGNGIKGMRERVLAQGGSLNWEQDSEGFTLEIELPLGVTDED